MSGHALKLERNRIFKAYFSVILQRSIINKIMFNIFHSSNILFKLTVHWQLHVSIFHKTPFHQWICAPAYILGTQTHELFIHLLCVRPSHKTACAVRATLHPRSILSELSLAIKNIFGLFHTIVQVTGIVLIMLSTMKSGMRNGKIP